MPNIEIKHTAGNWEMFNNREGTIGVVGYPSDIAYCCAPGLVLDQRRTEEEHEANARLIAAAPELLAAVMLAKEFEQHAGGAHLTASAWLHLHANLDAAIAKATGA